MLACLRGLLLACILVLLLNAETALAAQQVDLSGRIVLIRTTAMGLDVDGVLIVVDVTDIAPSYLATLSPGDDVRVTAFRLDDGTLLAYNVFLRSDEDPPVDTGPQGGTE